MEKLPPNEKRELSGLKKARKSPVPANYDRIIAGALNLPLKERVDIKNALAASIDRELKEMEEKLTIAKELIK